MPDVRVYGVRHHGPGSALSLKAALDAFRPDCVLVEGPPDADALIPLAAAEGAEPPLALLVYQADRPRRCAFFPFARFSPEWVAIRHALAGGVPVRFMDLPQAVRFGLDAEDERAAPAPEDLEADEAGAPPDLSAVAVRRDPLGELARAAGYPDGERWWDAFVESRTRAGEDVFAAVAEAMAALREAAREVETPSDPAEALREERREAHMRSAIRAAAKAGSERIAAVCGAWHAPALRRHDARGQAGADAAALKACPASGSPPPGRPGPTSGSPPPAATAPACCRPNGTTSCGATATGSRRAGSPRRRRCCAPRTSRPRRPR